MTHRLCSIEKIMEHKNEKLINGNRNEEFFAYLFVHFQIAE